MITQTIYLLASCIAVIAMVPQIRQLLVTKQSDELNMSTWATWAVCQFASLNYAASIKATPYIIVSIAWLGFYGAMVFLIIKYRSKSPEESRAWNTWRTRGELLSVQVKVFSRKLLVYRPKSHFDETWGDRKG
jgi:uncharacterized protein with PQ loop repeat